MSSNVLKFNRVPLNEMEKESKQTIHLVNGLYFPYDIEKLDPKLVMKMNILDKYFSKSPYCTLANNGDPKLLNRKYRNNCYQGFFGLYTEKTIESFFNVSIVETAKGMFDGFEICNRLIRNKEMPYIKLPITQAIIGSLLTYTYNIKDPHCWDVIDETIISRFDSKYNMVLNDIKKQIKISKSKTILH